MVFNLTNHASPIEGVIKIAPRQESAGVYAYEYNASEHVMRKSFCEDTSNDRDQPAKPHNLIRALSIHQIYSIAYK